MQTWTCKNGHVVVTPIPAQAVVCGECHPKVRGDRYAAVEMKRAA